MTPDTQSQIPLDQLNQIIAEQKGITVEELAVTDGSEESKPKKKPAEKKPVADGIDTPADLSAAEMRSKADALYKEAARLRKEADEIDPPKSKTKKVTAEAE
jgi:hypothetical protein